MYAPMKPCMFTVLRSIPTLEAHTDERADALHVAATAAGDRTQLTDVRIVVACG